MKKFVFLVGLVASSLAVFLALSVWFSGDEFAFAHLLLGMLGSVGLTISCILSADFVHVDDVFENSEVQK